MSDAARPEEATYRPTPAEERRWRFLRWLVLEGRVEQDIRPEPEPSSGGDAQRVGGDGR